jgi:hypothetical protein
MTTNKRANKMTQTNHPSIGNIYVRDYGYDCTHVAFYQVTKFITPKTFEIRLIGLEHVEKNKVMPKIDDFTGPPIRKRLAKNGLIKIVNQDFQDRLYAEPWDGKPCYYADAPYYGSINN